MQLVLDYTVIVGSISIVGYLILLLRDRLLRVVVKRYDDECAASGNELCRVEAQMTVALHIAHVGMEAMIHPMVQFLYHFIAYGLSFGKTASRESQTQCLGLDGRFC